MIFATTASIKKIQRAVADKEHHRLLSGIGHLKLVRLWLSSFPRISGIIFKSLRMKKKLSVEDFSKLKGQSIVEIRQEYGIVL